MTLKRVGGLNLSKRFLLIAAFAVAIVATISVIPDMQRMVAPAHAQSFPPLNGNYVVQASGTAIFIRLPMARRRCFITRWGERQASQTAPISA